MASFIAGKEEVEAAGGEYCSSARTRLFYNGDRGRNPDAAPLIHPVIRDLFLELNRHPEMQKLLRQLTPGQPRVCFAGWVDKYGEGDLPGAAVAGCRTSAPGIGGWQQTGGNALGTDKDVLRSTGDRSRHAAAAPHTRVGCPAHQKLSPHPEISEQRVTGVWRLVEGHTSIAVTPVASALLRTENADAYRQLAVTLETGEDMPARSAYGSSRERRIPAAGTSGDGRRIFGCAVGSFDVFPAEAEHPVRIEMFGDTIESMRRFEPANQRSVFKIEKCSILPLVEWPQSRRLLAEAAAHANLAKYPPAAGEPFPGWEFHIPLVKPRTGSIFELTPSAMVVVDEPEQVKSAAERLWIRLEEGTHEPVVPPEANFFRWEEIDAKLSTRIRAELRELEILDQNEPRGSAFRGQLGAPGDVDSGARSVLPWPKPGTWWSRVIAWSSSRPLPESSERLADIFQETRLPYPLGLSTAESTPAVPDGESVSGRIGLEHLPGTRIGAQGRGTAG